ncbi:MAG: hypothetical protein HOC74_01195 [Gemmatimonadetes bacterium]|nr:hypothetical protein [Gemmatimonadota bacterium]
MNEQPEFPKPKEAGFWAPKQIPQTSYTIDCQIDPAAGQLQGHETIEIENRAEKPISRLALSWSLSDDQSAEITAQGRPVQISLGAGDLLIVDLPEPLLPGEIQILEVDFSKKLTTHREQTQHTLTGWHPQLWWNFATHSAFSVRVEAPPEYTVGTSGYLDLESGHHRQEGAPSFGIFLGKDHQALEQKAGDVRILCVHTDRGADCARMILTTAVDVVRFYREHFDFYPYRSLTIVPGVDKPMGGYPVATAMVAIHGQEQFEDAPELHWKWITAHEIGHQYWGEYVLEKDRPAWLWIGLGIYADREYARARNLGMDRHRGLMQRYIDGVRQGLDTTVDIPPERLAETAFDFNNVVTHGKGYSIISALDCVLGEETFGRIYRRCLQRFGGRRLGRYEFQAMCEEESGQNLEWFFEQWVRSGKYLSYQISSEECKPINGRYETRVRVDRLGGLKMPVPVKALFADGTQQIHSTDRLLDTHILSFESSTPLKEVKLDPNEALALVVPPPPPTGKELNERLRELPWTGVDEKARELFRKAREADPEDANFWGVLGLKAYDGGFYPEALEAFRRAVDLTAKGNIWKFVATVWQGHLLDLLGQRDEAVQCYEKARELDADETMEHGQYDILIDTRWVLERLKTPFERS